MNRIALLSAAAVMGISLVGVAGCKDEEPAPAQANAAAPGVKLASVTLHVAGMT